MTSSSFLCRAGRTLLALALFTAVPAFSAPTISLSVIYAFDQYFPRLHAPGSAVTFTALSVPPGASLQWLHDDVAIPGANAASLPLTNLQAADSGNYTLRTTLNGASETSNALTVNVVPLPPSPVDASFLADLPPLFAAAYVMFAAPDGSVVIRDPGPLTPLIVRLNPDGSQDSSYQFPVSAGDILAGYADRTVITSSPPYRLNPDGSPRALALPPGFLSSLPLTAAAIQPDGKLLLAQNQRVVRLNADDSVDSSFVFAPGFSTLREVDKIQLDATGRMYVTAFDNDTYATVLFRLTATGALDTVFAARRGGSLVEPFPAIYILSDQRVLFYTVENNAVIWSMLKDDGSVDPSWSAPAITAGFSFVVDPVNFRMFFIGAQGVTRAKITATSLDIDPTFYQGDGLAFNLALTSSGQLMALAPYSQWDGHAVHGFARLRPDGVVNVPPTASIGPEVRYPNKGSAVTLTASMTGTGPLSYQWLALDGQSLPANTTSSTLAIPNFGADNIGRYQLRVTGPGGSILSNVTRLAYSPGEPHLANLSGRAFVGVGDDTAIAGIAVAGTKVPLLIRGAGPALAPYGVAHFLPNPVIDLFSATGQLLRDNDKWGGGLDLQQAAAGVGAFPFATDSNDAAFTTPLSTGNYTVQLTDISRDSGVGLLEVYRLNDNPAAAGEIVNLSLRARTGPGEKVATAGFVVFDPQGFGRSLKLLLRVVGPTLSQYGVVSPLADPVLTLYGSANQVIATNDNWSGGSDADTIAAAARQVGAFALSPGTKDAAILLDVPAGVYSIQGAAAPGTPDSGVTLVEIYVLK